MNNEMTLAASIPAKFLDAWMAHKGINENDPDLGKKILEDKTLMRLDVSNMPKEFYANYFLYEAGMTRRYLLNLIKSFTA